MRSAQHPRPEGVQERVAANVREQLARQRCSGRKAAEALGWRQQFLARRLRGDIPFDVNELAALAGLLKVPVELFFAGVDGQHISGGAR